MHDRWDRSTFSLRSVEDIKERYYSILEKLERVHGGATGEQVRRINVILSGGRGGSRLYEKTYTGLIKINYKKKLICF